MSNLKSLFAIAALLVLIAGTSCTSLKNVPQPCQGNKYETDKKFYRARFVGQSLREDVAMKMGKANAREELATQMRDHIRRVNHDFLADYAKYFKNKELNYNVYKHLSILLKQKRIDLKNAGKIRKEIVELMKKSDKFLFPQAKDLVKKLNQEKKEMILLSFGDHVFQSQKIKYLSIRKYFKKIIITSRDKDQVVDFLKKSKEAHIIINDKPRESLALKKELSLVGAKARIILVKGPYSKNALKNRKFYALKDIARALEFNLSQSKIKSGGLKIKVLSEGREVGRLFLYILLELDLPVLF